ncbi:hypothetical protein QFC22_002845 [Naganishia vaughanmartiniae]|uniref:Uncharacterized protein n=1 Tax=Naganishia vaughanmartiniae TaxID=1424756 RepID=A0ACC2XA62_9TREE|nr:hypothetical protein QFC22_002845 [Naganishia vaughanmartiniae]
MAAMIYIPARPPPYAAPLAKELLGLSIEGDRFEDWTGPLGQPNQFTHQALRNISDRTGTSCPIRWGADSQDKYKITDGVRTVKVILSHTASESTPYPEPATSGVHIGPDYFALARNLPTGTKLTIGLNLRDQNEQETIAQARLLYDTFYGTRKAELKHVELELVTIGNEPDLYEVPLFHRTGPPGWSPYKYVEQTIQLANAVSSVFHGNIHFQIASITGFFKDQEQWNPRTVLGSGLMDDPIFEKMTVYSSHMYFGDLKATSGSLMNKTFIRQMIRHWSEYRPMVEAAGLEFRIGETNSLARGGVSGISNAAEASIWLVDYALHAACLGLKRLHFHHRVGQSYNWFDPVPITGISGGTHADARDAPSIHAPYYGALVLAEAVGMEPGTQIVELASIHRYISAYGIYSKDGKLIRAVFINSEPYLDASKPRPVTEIELKTGTGLSLVGSKMKTLFTSLTTSTSGMTWAGQSYETSTAMPSGTLVETRYDGDSSTLRIAASEVTLLLL